MLAWEKIQQLSVGYHQRFQQELNQPLEAQTAFLQKILNANKTTQFGQEYDFENITSIKDFQQKIPIQNYADLEPYINDIFHHAEFKNDVNPLTKSAPFLFEKTSGSSGAAKLIPYNEVALEDFRHAIFPWLYDLCTELPSIMDGSSYWSISPAARETEKSPSGIPIGMSNDALYFGAEAAEHIQNILSVPAWVSQIESIEAWRYISLRFLLCDDNLRLISIWSPTFLLQLVDTLLNQDYAQRIIADIASGGSDNVNSAFPELSAFQQEVIFKPNPQRAAIIAQAITVKSIQHNKRTTINTKALWPKLQLISCWASASSHVYAKQLQALFPDVLVQGKGLFATEGAITLPIMHTQDPVLSLHSGFYEFIANDGSIHLCNELNTGETYAVLLTNNTGLYRYKIGDLVTVTAWHEATPCLRFDGRAGLNTDLCGEKITEQFVLPHLKEIAGFTLLVPVNDYKQDEKLHYRIYVDVIHISGDVIEKTRQQLETRLYENPQYAYARKLGQLGSVKVIPCIKPFDSYEKFCIDKGMVLGDIKPASLSSDTQFHTCFTFAAVDSINSVNAPSVKKKS